MPGSFRVILREKTRAEHARVDRVFSDLDIADRNGFTHFASVHLLCFEAIKKRAARRESSELQLDMMVLSLKHDLATMQRHGLTDAFPWHAKPVLGELDQLAIDYLVAGSRLGSKVLKSRWSISKDKAVKDAACYFSMEAEPLLWQNTCRALSCIPVHSPRAHKVIHDARQMFGLFEATHRDLVSAKAGEGALQ